MRHGTQAPSLHKVFLTLPRTFGQFCCELDLLSAGHSVQADPGSPTKPLENDILTRLNPQGSVTAEARSHPAPVAGTVRLLFFVVSFRNLTAKATLLGQKHPCLLEYSFLVGDFWTLYLLEHFKHTEFILTPKRTNPFRTTSHIVFTRSLSSPEHKHVGGNIFM